MSFRSAVSSASICFTAIFFAYGMLLQRAQSQINPGIFGQQSPVDCTDEANADNPSCTNARVAPTAQPAPQQAPQGSAKPAPYNDTERLYVDQATDKTLRDGDLGRRRAPFNNPEPLTEFQKLVRASTRVVLPIYGASLFTADQPSTFAPANQIPVTSDYVVGPGDEVLLRTWGQVTLNARLTVDREGSIFIPRVGQVRVAGLSYAQMAPALRSEIGGLYRNFDLDVSMGQLRSVQIFVVGYARHPGSYTVSSLSTLVNAVFSSGGPASNGSMRDIQLKRNGHVITGFDLYDLLLEGDKSKDVLLAPGDVIYFPAVGPQIAVAGSVRVPAIYELRTGYDADTVGSLVNLAGGLSEAATTQHATIERIKDREAREDLDVRLDAAGTATALHAGDLLHVLSMVPRFEGTVTLRGNVANPGRYVWHPGMRVHDLIPDEKLLLTREYWRRKDALGAFVPDTYSDLDTQDENRLEARRSRDAETYPGSEDSNAGLLGPSSANSADYDQAGSQLLTGNTAEGALKAEAAASGRQQPATVSGPMALAASSESNPNHFPIKNALTRSAADLDWRYAAIQRLGAEDLTTNVLSFNLRDAVFHEDSSANLPLDAGDVVTIFSTADMHVPQEQQVKFVQLEGEFKDVGVYQAAPDETLRQLVERVGGITRKAYLYGSIFTRETTREQQQQRLDEFAGSLEREIEVEGANLSSSVTSATAAALTGTGQQSQLSLVANLRSLRATGRIVLKLPSNASDPAALPDLPLEDGDHFFIPALPSSVNVVGAVYNQNAFLFTGRLNLGDYLKQAGGSNRDGDTKHAFLIRADGSVISRSTEASTLWDSGFSRLAMHPGDTIVVPDNINRKTLLRGLTDWSQVFAQFALGAAAVNVIR